MFSRPTKANQAIFKKNDVFLMFSTGVSMSMVPLAWGEHVYLQGVSMSIIRKMSFFLKIAFLPYFLLKHSC